MKKRYVKPDIVFESFMLCTSLASTCDYSAHNAMYQCPYEEEWDGGTIAIFTSNMLDCDYPSSGLNGEVYDDRICYHNPSNMSNVFGS